VHMEYRNAHVTSGVEDALLGPMERLGQVVAAQE
jgi:hypothetical protein